MLVPCIVKRELYAAEVINPVGLVSSVLIQRAAIPPKKKKNKVIAKILKYTSLQDGVIQDRLRENIEKGFSDKLRGLGLFAVIKSCTVTKSYC